MNEYLVNVLITVQGVTVHVELLASALKLLFIESEEMTLTRVNPCVIMAKLLGRYILHSGLFDDYAFKAAQ